LGCCVFGLEVHAAQRGEPLVAPLPARSLPQVAAVRGASNAWEGGRIV
jgi:hypothetical protein